MATVLLCVSTTMNVVLFPPGLVYKVPIPVFGPCSPASFTLKLSFVGQCCRF